VPAPHVVQDPSPAAVVTVPAPQLVHAELTAAEYFPAEHVAHADSPAVDANVPAAQLEHEARPDAVVTVPAPQVLHAVLPDAEYCPAGHVAHVSPVVAEAWPAGHAVVGQLMAVVPPAPEK
jgi:hypothetical protein